MTQYPPAPPPGPGYLVPTGAPVGPPGKIRGTGVSILLFVVTFGIYGLVWWYLVHDEMRRHRGVGLGGGLALVVAFFVSPVMAFLTPNEIGEMYGAAGQPRRVTALTGLWYFPGYILIVPAIVWFVRTNSALNDYWRACGVQR